MTGLALVLGVVGVLALGGGAWLLRSTGAAWRVARLLAAAPQVPLADVVAAGADGDAEPRYLRTHGRISSDEEFPDEHERPLVFRRTLLQRGDGGWRTLDEQRLAVPFGIEDRSSFLAIDVDALGSGLVVVPREATGIASEMPPELAAAAGDLPADTPVRVRIDQVSAVEHATVAGVVVRGPDGAPRLTAGLGRPLILTTVDPAAAMRLLASDNRRRVLAAAGLLVIGLGLLAGAIVAALLGSAA
ncbi:MAG: hypothetical protein QOH61_1548 [Chloroflexota bacterium]|nr:hypothetical protein [Chloroflexota bacterium]